jgi:hypothetical protein
VVEADDVPVNLGGISVTSKEFQAEWADPESRLDDGLSIDRRPDAISFDYLNCYSLGPIQLGDFSAGPVNRPWRIRASGGIIYSSRQGDDGIFEPEEIVFTFSGTGATEIDAAFDQSAHILVCMERATGVGGSPEIWIYYYDPFLVDYALTNFGAGRTPRAILDDILDSANADILVFYLADSVGMCWRQQRERYLTERVVPTVFDLPNTYIEDVYKATSGRVVIIYSVHDPVLGTYSLNTAATVLYPYLMETEAWQALNTIPFSGSLNKALMYILPPGELDPAGDPPAAYDEIDSWKVLVAYPLSGDLHDIVILHTLYDIDAWKANVAYPLSGILLVVIVLHTLYDVDEWKTNTAYPVSGILFLAVIEHSLYDVDTWKVNTAFPLSGTLV